MPIENHLLTGETILASCVEKEFTFFCTDKRVIKYKSGGTFKKEIMHDLSYREISSLSLVNEKGNRTVAIVGALIVLAGLSIEDGLMLAIIGGALLAYGFLYSKNWFEFKGSGLLQNEVESEKWRLHNVNNPQVEYFVRTVRQTLSDRNY